MRPDPDAAFFEDWSAWSVLGGNGVQPRHKQRAGDYWCVLLLNIIPLDKKPGFVLRVPGDIRISRLLKSAGAVQDRDIPGAQFVNFEGQLRYYVPAKRWHEMRAVLPRIKAIIAERHQ